MNANDLFDAIGEIDDELVCETPRKRNSVQRWHRRWMTAAVAAVLAVCVTLAMMMLPGDPIRRAPSHTPDYSPPLTRGFVLAEAAYPDYEPYPTSLLLNAVERTQAREEWLAGINAKWKAYQDADRDINDFTVQAMEAFLADTNGENKVFSPLNVYIALSMLAEVTDGDSHAQLMELLGIESLEQLREWVSLLWETHYYDEEDAKSLLANSLWLSDTLNYDQQTVDTLASDYYASSFQGTMGSEDYDKQLQAWLSAQTMGLLDEPIGELSLDPATVLALVSTVYFEAHWLAVFDRDRTEEGVFHGTNGDVICEFMKEVETQAYYTGNEFSAIKKEFSMEGRLNGEMWLIRPNDGVKVEALASDKQVISCVTDPDGWEQQETALIHLAVPKFDVNSSIDLTEGLKSLGVTDVFDESAADFTPLTDLDSVYVSEAQHEARVRIDETGCTAAAYTEFQMLCGSVMSAQVIEFTLDEPFLFVITSEVGTPLFIGVVNQL